MGRTISFFPGYTVFTGVSVAEQCCRTKSLPYGLSAARQGYSVTAPVLGGCYFSPARKSEAVALP